jgi:hypothetical protein
MMQQHPVSTTQQQQAKQQQQQMRQRQLLCMGLEQRPAAFVSRKAGAAYDYSRG